MEFYTDKGANSPHIGGYQLTQSDVYISGDLVGFYGTYSSTDKPYSLGFITRNLDFTQSISYIPVGTLPRGGAHGTTYFKDSDKPGPVTTYKLTVYASTGRIYGIGVDTNISSTEITKGSIWGCTNGNKSELLTGGRTISKVVTWAGAWIDGISITFSDGSSIKYGGSGGAAYTDTVDGQITGVYGRTDSSDSGCLMRLGWLFNKWV